MPQPKEVGLAPLRADPDDRQRRAPAFQSSRLPASENRNSPDRTPWYFFVRFVKRNICGIMTQTGHYLVLAAPVVDRTPTLPGGPRPKTKTQKTGV